MGASDESTFQVFVSYATPDRERVNAIAESLERSGFLVWMDHKFLLPGHNWDFEITRAFEKSTFVLAFISENSFQRRGYVQRELKLAIDRRNEKLTDDIYLIPVLLDETVEVPHELRKIQYISANSPDCVKKISIALKLQIARLGRQQVKVQEAKDVHWTKRRISESWDGLPGYEVEIELLEFRSSKFGNIEEIGQHISGAMLPHLFEQRLQKLTQMPSIYNYGQESHFRTNTFDAHCREPIVVGKLLSIEFVIHWFGAGAAHPNHHFETFVYVLDPLFQITSIEEVCEDPSLALAALQSEIRTQLLQKTYLDESGNALPLLEDGSVKCGTADWSDLKAFVFEESGLTFYFPPYQVGPYACGSHTTTVSYDVVLPLLRNEFVSAIRA
jgi:hypothetical protein